MNSARPKVLHEVAGRSMLGHVLAAVSRAGARRRSWSVPRGTTWRARRDSRSGAEVFVQAERLGTAHAVLSARRRSKTRPTTSWSLSATRRSSRPRPSSGCGRRSPRARPSSCSASRPRIRPATAGCLDGRRRLISAIREDKDASPEERAITLCNGGLMALRRRSRARDPRSHRQRQRQGRVLPDRHRRIANAASDKVVAVIEPPRTRCRASTTGRSSPRPSGDPAAPARGGDGGGRDADRARDGVLQLRHADRPGRGGRAARGLRPGVVIEDGASSTPSAISKARTSASGAASALRAAAAGRVLGRRRRSAISSRSRTPRSGRAPRSTT